MPLPLDKLTLQTAAAQWQIESAKLRAVWLVEAAGRGFLPSGRPKILLERQYVWKRLIARGIDPKPLAAAHPELCGPEQDSRYYLGGEREWSRLLAVIGWGSHTDPARWESYKKAGMEACSWGGFQLMGANYRDAGFGDVYGLVHALEEGEPRQLEVILTWMKATGLLFLLREGRWLLFARGYNGPKFAAGYAARLLAAYVRAKATGW